MVARKASEPNKPKRPPATTPEARERQLIAMAYDLAEKQLAEGTASSQVISSLLKAGSQRERLEQKKIAEEHKLLQAKTEAVASSKRVEELYGKALNAMRKYAGQDDEEEFYD